MQEMKPNETIPDGEIAQRFAELSDKLDPQEYNFEHFRAKHFLDDVRRTIQAEGLRPGDLAPDFTLPQVGGGTLRLSELRGQPVLLHFGSPT